MKRALLIAAAALTALAIPAGEMAFAQGRGHGGRGGGPAWEGGGRAVGGDGGRWERGGDRGPPARSYERRDDDRRDYRRRDDYERRDYERRDYERRDDYERRIEDSRRSRFEDDGRRARGEGPPIRSLAPPRAAPRRGGYLPDGYRGGVISDYQRYRLRPPPHGYGWVRVGGGYALVSLADGQVFDVIPD
jgi:Ni/Co efflux regulator RcnB